jgi:orotate phosphoribosyltransferase
MATTMISSQRHVIPGRSSTDAVTALLAARTGHFLLESGHHGDLWLELDGMFWSAAEIDPQADLLAARIRPHDVDVVCGPLVGGALLAQLVAARLGVAFCYTERASTGSGTGLYSATYRLPSVLAARLPGKRVAIVDDVVNAGSAVRATLAEVTAARGEVVALGALLTLGATPAAFAADANLPLESLATRSSDIWEPARCPKCAAGEPLEKL